MINYWLDCWKKFADFSGRSRRSEYWYFQLMNMIIVYGGGFLLAQISPSLSMIVLLYSFASFLPSLAAAVRRMHDTNHSGWFILIPLYNLVLACTDGDRGPNQYGDDPKDGGGHNLMGDSDILDA